MITTGLLKTEEPGFYSRFAPKTPTLKEYYRQVNQIPSEIILDCGVKLYPLMNLTWGYVETICSLCKQIRIYETKKLIRTIKELKLNYDRFRQSSMGDLETMQETEMGEWFEDRFTADFDKLFNGIDNLAKVVSKDKNERILCIAVHQALTLIEAVMKYARKCDERVRATGIRTCDYCFVQADFLKMINVVKRFPTAKDERFVQLRELSSNILHSRMNKVEVGTTEEGRIWMRAN